MDYNDTSKVSRGHHPSLDVRMGRQMPRMAILISSGMPVGPRSLFNRQYEKSFSYCDVDRFNLERTSDVLVESSG